MNNTYHPISNSITRGNYYTVESPYVTTSRNEPPAQNTKISPVKALYRET